MAGKFQIVLFTDLDGTLLDYDTYSWAPAEEALDRCKALRIPVVIVSSKTRAEMDPLRKVLGLSDPFVSENGGGIFFPRDSLQIRPPSQAVLEGDLWRWSLGAEYSSLVKALREIREELGWEIRGFSDMGIDEIADNTGLSLYGATLSARREFDEPFTVLSPAEPDFSMLKRAVEKRGLTVTSGGRFYHLKGESDKGNAMMRLVEWYRQGLKEAILTVALGDGENDLPMLRLADFPVLVRSKHGNFPVHDRIENLLVTDEPGPDGWRSAVLRILASDFL